MPEVSIVVPVLNEEKILESSLKRLAEARPPSTWEILVVDSGSRDDSSAIARRVCNARGWGFIAAEIESPSVGRAVSVGVRNARGEIVLVLPCDAYLKSFTWLVKAIENGARCGGFPKTYEPSTRVLRWYAAAQNLIRTRVRRHLVWTNGMFFPKGTLIPTRGFLEDVALSDRLRLRADWTLVPEKIHVSARRYYPDRILRRIVVNGTILSLHRLNLMEVANLRRLYS